MKQKKSKILHSSKRVMKEKYDEIFFFNNKEVFQYGYSIILKVLKYVLQSRSYMHVAARGAPFTRAHHLYTNVLFFFYVIIFLFVLSLFVILMINIDIHIPRVLSLTLVLLVRAKRV
jgi:hypothetical protein